MTAVADDNIPLQWEDVKDLSLCLGGEDANQAAFNEMTTGQPNVAPTPEQIAAYQTQLGQKLEDSVGELETGLQNAPKVTPAYQAPDSRYDDEVRENAVQRDFNKAVE